MHCRWHAAQLRRRYQDIHASGADVVAIGTGDARYARAFVDQERIPFLVLLDENGEAARAASVKRGGLMALVGPKSIAHATRAYAHGVFQHRTGKRPKQLGATFVLGPGPVVRYEHLDDDVADHAPIDDVLASLG